MFFLVASINRITKASKKIVPVIKVNLAEKSFLQYACENKGAYLTETFESVASTNNK